MKCPKCNTENENGAKFCAGCGSSMSNLINTNRNNMPNNNLSLKKNRKNVRKKIITICACVLASLIVVGGVGILIYASKYAGCISYDNGAVMIDKNAISLGTDASNSKVLSYNDDKLVIGSKQSSLDDEEINANYDLGNLHIGSVLFSGPVDGAPGGFIKRVTGITKNPDGTVSVTTEQAALTDVFGRLHVSTSGDITSGSTTQVTEVKTGNSSPISELFAEKAYATEYGASVGTGKQFTLGDCVTLALSISVDAKIDIEDHKLQSAEILVHPEASLTVTAKAGIKFTETLKFQDINLPPTHLPTPLGPIPITNKLTPSIQASISVSEQASLGYSFTFGRTVGFRYTGEGDPEFVNEDHTTNPDPSFTAGLSVSISAAAGPALTFTSKIMDTIGISFTISVSANSAYALKVLSATDPDNGALTLPGISTKFKGTKSFGVNAKVSVSFVFGAG